VTKYIKIIHILLYSSNETKSCGCCIRGIERKWDQIEIEAILNTSSM